MFEHLDNPINLFVSETKTTHAPVRDVPHEQVDQCTSDDSDCVFVGTLVPPGLFVNPPMLQQMYEKGTQRDST